VRDPHTVATLSMNMASLDKLLGLLAASNVNQHWRRLVLRSDRNSTIGLENFAQFGCRKERLARETFPAFPPGFLSGGLDGDLLFLVRVRVELINLFVVFAGLRECVDGVGGRKRCMLV